MSGTYYKHILAAIDLSEDNRKVIEKAVDRARSNLSLDQILIP